MALENRIPGPYKPAHIANAFLSQGMQEGVTVDHLKLQKLVYILHGFHLAIRGRPASGEMFEAWKYGPVIESLYHSLRHNGSRPIKEYIQDFDSDANRFVALRVNPDIQSFYKVFNVVWEKYSRFSGLTLSTMTHKEGSPWYTARELGQVYILDEDIKRHFTKIIEDPNYGYRA